MAYALTALALVIGLAVFATKYIVVFANLNFRERNVLLARVFLCIVAIVVLVAPLDFCAAWSFPLHETLLSAFIVALVEVYGLACDSRCSVGAAASALLFSLINADHNDECGAGFFAASVAGLVAAPFLWAAS